MKMVAQGLLLSVILLVSLATPGLFAQSDRPDLAASTKLSLDDSFRTGWHEAVTGSGVEIAIIGGKGRPAIDYVMAYVQAGYFFYDPSGTGWLRGNLEFMPEVFGSAIYATTGRGHYIAGGTLNMRYNFIQPEWRVIPYLQGGAGLTSMDIDHQYDGMNFNFNLSLGIGARYMLTHHCALSLEGLFQHISNANLGSRNIGLNSFGPRVGVSWFF